MSLSASSATSPNYIFRLYIKGLHPAASSAPGYRIFALDILSGWNQDTSVQRSVSLSDQGYATACPAGAHRAPLQVGQLGDPQGSTWDYRQSTSGYDVGSSFAVSTGPVQLCLPAAPNNVAHASTFDTHCYAANYSYGAQPMPYQSSYSLTLPTRGIQLQTDPVCDTILQYTTTFSVANW